MAITDPTEITDLLLWFDAADAASITEVGGEVSQWNDKSATGDNLTQATPALQPNTSTVDGRPSIFFDGANRIANTAITAVGDPDDMTIVAVVTPTVTAGNADYVGFYQGNSFRWSARKAGTTYQWFINGATNGFIRLIGAAVADETNWQIFRTRLTGTGNNDGLDSNGITASETPAITPTSPADSFVVGSFANGTSALTGHIHEVIVYDRRISDAERDDLAEYLNAKWIGIVNLEGAISGQSSLSGDSPEILTLSSSLLGASDLSADLSIGKDLSGSLIGASALSAGLNIGKDLSGSLLGSSALSADLNIGKDLSGSVAGTTTFSGTFNIGKDLSGSLLGSSDLSADLNIGKDLSGSLLGSSDLSADLSIGKDLSGAVVGQTTLSGTLAELSDLEGSAEGQSSLLGSLSIGKLLQGSVEGQSSLSGLSSIVHSLSGVLAGQSTLVGGVLLRRELEGAIGGQSQMSGKLSGAVQVPDNLAAKILDDDLAVVVSENNIVAKVLGQ